MWEIGVILSDVFEDAGNDRIFDWLMLSDNVLLMLSDIKSTDVMGSARRKKEIKKLTDGRTENWRTICWLTDERKTDGLSVDWRTNGKKTDIFFNFLWGYLLAQ